MSPDKFTQNDAKELTESTDKETSQAWHQARQDCQKSDNPYDQHLSSGWSRNADEKQDIPSKS